MNKPFATAFSDPLSLLVAFLMLAPLAACAPPGRPPLEGARIGGPFALTDQNGRRVTEKSWPGQYRLMYFGYTYCPDVCPVDMQNIGAGLRLLEKSDPAIAAKLTPIFITVDPARDTPPVLKAFVAAFHPRIVGLTGNEADIAATAKKYAIFYRRADATPDGGYIVDHARQAYLMDPANKPIALVPQDETPEAIASEIRKWVR